MGLFDDYLGGGASGAEGLFSDDGAGDVFSQVASGGLAIGMNWLKDRLSPDTQTVTPQPTVIAVQAPPKQGAPVDAPNSFTSTGGTILGMPTGMALGLGVAILAGVVFLARR